MFTMDNLIAAFTAAWQRSFDYTGRSKRGDYWWYALANLIISVVLLILSAFSDFFGWIYSIWAVATIVPSLAVTVRRLRDAGKHWAWIFIGLIPLVGSIWLIYLLVQPSAASLG
jgi:uncharacterized membrane protein YhaH (DUF805 family)